ncbi:hypothetical protein DL766_000972 [Monosporascus sp. MC13-8B]|uniref:Btz domain-containing protein n=1 Tax=Monosporascus cannonballus TaxID=155416 RepID=A0ABY0HBN3_9PEZI|nr:hypothetical protein DL762_003523 [Monosporascus cannonballus]RYO98609.1 hypothetical protein DL763_002139 [Monosporascus cannonballus]RYP38394.1 hypothetical protein DL766_000972 [Monosporascus sp. MC13-8B]
MAHYTATSSNPVPAPDGIVPDPPRKRNAVPHPAVPSDAHRGTDELAAQKLAEFDGWYESAGINNYLRERLAARDEKRQRQGYVESSENTARGGMGTGGRGGNRGGRGGRGTRGGSRVRGRGGPSIQTNGGHISSNTGSGRYDIKPEAGDGGSSFRPGHDSTTAESYPNHQQINPSSMMEFIPPAETFHPSRPLSEHHHEDQDAHDDEDGSNYVPSEGENSPLENNSLVAEEDTASKTGDDMLRLKGAQYPGMGGFDAATTLQRRMRNQRKPREVVSQLELSSRLITTVETVCDLNLDPQRERDVYDDPSEDETANDDGNSAGYTVSKKRKRRSTASSTSTGARRARAGTALHGRAGAAQPARRSRTSARLQGAASADNPRTPTSTRATRAATGRALTSEAQPSTHSHGLHDDADIIDPDEEHSGDFLWTRRREYRPGKDHEKLPGLALRPGNPNLSFAAASNGLKGTLSPLYPGKENGHLAFQSPNEASNPYLNSNDSYDGNYNPLYFQSRDGVGFRIFPYEEDEKPPTTGFQPINGHGTFSSLHMTPHHTVSYQTEQHNGNTYEL